MPKKPSLRQRTANKLSAMNRGVPTTPLTAREKQYVPKLARSPRAGFNAQLLQNAKAGLRRADYGTASSSHDMMHVRRSAGQTPTEFVDFMRSTRTALATLDSAPVGHQMLSDLNAGNNADMDIASNQLVQTNVHFRDSADNRAVLNHPGGAVATSPAYRRNGQDGAGDVTSTVHWNPNLHQSDHTPRPSFIGLGHELVHSWRAMKGTTVRRDFPGAPGLRQLLGPVLRDRDELETVGLHQTPRHLNAPTENRLRAEHAVVARPSYSGRTQATHRAHLTTLLTPVSRVKQRMAKFLMSRIG